jgi:hypothetical protein
MVGALADGAAVADAIERFWSELVPWVERRGIALAEARQIPF